MKNAGGAPKTVNPDSFQTTTENTARDKKSVIEIATDLVDSVTQMLCRQITAGDLDVNQEQRVLDVRIENIQIQSNTIDLDEHKKKIRKFMMMNKKLKRKRQMRSLEMSERSIKIQQETERSREESKVKALEERRKQIEKRMEAKKMMLKEIQQSVLESNVKYKSVKKKKFLYQQKQEEYYKKFILPKIQEQKCILENKKSLRKPIDMTELFQHQRHYEELKINQRMNRSITVRMIKEKDRDYSPPEFIPQSFKKLRQEEELRREEEELKKKEIQINDIRKREYSKRLDQIRAKERELSRSFSKSPKNKQKVQKQKVKQTLPREQVKNMGNQYLKDLLKSNRKFASTTKKLKKMAFQQQVPKRIVRSEYEIQIVKEERVQKIQRIRNKKIDSIVNDKKIDENMRMEKLRAQIDRLDQAASDKLKEKDDIETINESASIMMNSIHAKLALLGVRHQ